MTPKIECQGCIQEASGNDKLRNNLRRGLIAQIKSLFLCRRVLAKKRQHKSDLNAQASKPFSGRASPGILS